MPAVISLDADAFMRKYLEQPSDATARLVFADWLEEQGEPHNRAWAYYIRLKAETDRYPADSAQRHELDRQAGEYAVHIRARLTIPAKLFVGYPKSLLQLLPAPYLTVNLSQFMLPRATLEHLPESVARENRLFPLDVQGDTFLLAAANPNDLDLGQRLEFILNRNIVLVGADADDVQRAINRGYDQTETEVVETPDLEFVDTAIDFEAVPGTYPVADGPEFLDEVLWGGERRSADLVTFVPQSEVVRVYYRAAGGSVEAGRISRTDWEYVVLPEVLRRGEAAGTEFTVEVVRNGGDRAVRIWL